MSEKNKKFIPKEDIINNIFLFINILYKNIH